MKAELNSVVKFHYSLSSEGAALESSREREPLTILLGAGNIIPGLESAILGREIGERFEVTIAPKEGYGERREDWTQRVPKKYFDQGARLQPGATTVLSTKEGQRVVTIIKVGQSVVDVDLTHPMAGKTLCFDIELVEVRSASQEEIAHGHVHGDGGHQH